MSQENQTKNRKQARLASIVILVAFVLWILLQVLGGRLGLPVRFAFLLDFAVLGALAWSMYVLFNVWRNSEED